MNNLTHEERKEMMEVSLKWVCGVIEECEMDTRVVVIQELLDVLFDLQKNQEE